MNLTNLNSKLKLADHEEDSINLFYEVIQDNPSILEDIDSKQFVETPLHIAAYRGHIQFATEIMYMKPSFASKLNLQALSPIHLAMEQDQNRMVLCLVDMNKDIVRIKGKGGLTPLHFVSRSGDLEHLAKFLDVCPDSMEDLTVKGETALHIAVKNNNYEALHLLVSFLRKNFNRGALKLKNKILNQKDEVDGNTILHILAQRNFEPQVANALGLLLKARINLNIKNFQGQTALDMAHDVDIRRILLKARAKPGLQVRDALTLAQKLRLNTSIMERMVIFVRVIRRSISEEDRDTWLVVATLVATSAYQSALSPPGGVYQANASDNIVNTTSSNSTISTPRNAGKSVLSKDNFILFSLTNMLSLFVSTIAIFILTPGGIVAPLVSSSVAYFALCYTFSMERISPTSANSLIVKIVSYSIVFVVMIYFSILLYSLWKSRPRAMLRRH